MPTHHLGLGASTHERWYGLRRNGPFPARPAGHPIWVSLTKGVPLTPDPVRTPLRRLHAQALPAAGAPTLISTSEAAERLGVSPNTLRGYVASGLISCRRVGPKLLKFDADEIARFAQTVSNA
jgi:excisionase family DNA binding protein